MSKEQLIEEITTGNLTTVGQIEYAILHELDEKDFHKLIDESNPGSKTSDIAAFLLSEHGVNLYKETEKVFEDWKKSKKPLTAETIINEHDTARAKEWFDKEYGPAHEHSIFSTKDCQSFFRCMAEFASQHNAELKEQFDRYYKQWDNQRTTIRNFHDIYKKHFGYDEMSDSENLDKQIESLRKKLEEQKQLIQNIKHYVDKPEFEFGTNEFIVWKMINDVESLTSDKEKVEEQRSE